jgi:hypothetical protein
MGHLALCWHSVRGERVKLLVATHIGTVDQADNYIQRQVIWYKGGCKVGEEEEEACSTTSRRR